MDTLDQILRINKQLMISEDNFMAIASTSNSVASNPSTSSNAKSKNSSTSNPPSSSKTRTASNDSVKSIEASRDNFQTAWKTQGQAYWVKFMTLLRYNVDTVDSKYNSNEFDYIFVEVLKNLVAKKFGKVFNYLVNVNKLIECKVDLGQLLETSYLQKMSAQEKKEYFNIFTTIFGENYTEIHTEKIKYMFSLHCKISEEIILVLKSKDTKTEETFKLPACWLEDECRPGPYEVFLRARWGGELTKLLDCDKEELKWWHAPADNSGKPNLSQPFNGALKLIYETPCSWLPKLHEFPPIAVQISKEMSELDFFTRLKKYKVSMYLWEIFELSIPPVLARKFYFGKGGLLLENDDEHHYLAICPWFVLWQNSFGIEYMKLIQNMQLEYEEDGLDSIEEGVTWEDRMIEYKKVLTTALSKYGAPYKVEECAEDPEDFLIEPCFLIQLPYSPVLFQQWLSGALIEVLKFEYTSLELRHLPIPQKLEQIAIRLLHFNKKLKERILLGMCLLAKQVAIYPEIDNEYAPMIMDQVIIPATTGLEFLTKGSAYPILYRFRQMAWSTSTPREESDLVTVPESAYTIHPALSKFYVHHPWHMRYWMHKDIVFEPFPARLFMGYNFDRLIELLNSDYDQKCKYENIQTKSYGLEEDFVFTDHKVEMSQVPREESIKIAKEVVEEHFKSNYFANFEGDIMEILSNAMSGGDNAIPLIGQGSSLLGDKVLQYVTFFQDLCGSMNNIERDHSWLSWVVRLSSEILKKEQVVRTVAAVSILSNQMPVVNTLEMDQFPSISEINQLLALLSSHQKLKNRSWLENKFPEAWRNPILSPSLQLNPEEHRTLGDIIQTMEDRVGRLIYNVAWKYINEGPESSNKFEALCAAQYLLPCYMSIHFCGSLQLLFFKNPLKCAILSNFLITVIIRYECYFKLETKKKRGAGKERYTGVELSQTENVSILPQSFCKEVLVASERVSKYLFERVHDFFAEYNALDMMKIMFDGMFEWPNYSESDKELCKVESLLLKAWQVVGTDHLRDARENCRQAWNLPKPGMSLNKKELKAAYHASEVIARLSILTCRFGGDYPGLKQLREYELLLKMMKILPEWRHNLLIRVLYTQNAIGINVQYANTFTDEDISTFSRNYLDLLSKVLGLMRRCREYLGYTLNTVISPNLGYESSHVTNHILDFNLGNIDNIFKSLRLKTSCKGDAQTETDIREMAFKYLNITIEPTLPSNSEKKAKKVNKKKIIELVPTGIECYNKDCGKPEYKKDEFVKCEKCIKDKYPEVNYFCNDACRTSWWDAEHMAEHLEFELGLC